MTPPGSEQAAPLISPPSAEIGFADRWYRWPDASPVRSPLLWLREFMEFNR